MKLAEFAEAAVAYCMATNGRVTSWIRPREHNIAEAGSAEASYHQLGLAIDVVYRSNRPDPDVRVLLAKRVGLSLIQEGDHDHLQPL